MNLNFSQQQVSVFRLQRHNLSEKKQKNIVNICSSICGAQAQVLSAAYLSLFCRNQNITKQKIDDALIKKRALVRTSLMRQTLHIIPSNEFSLYINALKRSRTDGYLKVLARFGVTKKQIDRLNRKVVTLLSGEPMDKNELLKIIEPQLDRKMSHWAYLVWNIFKPAIINGLICYYPSGGNKSTFILTNNWLPPQKDIPEDEAKRILLKNYLRAYGPITVKDFAFWSGMLMKEATETWELLKDEILEVKVEGLNKYILKKDLTDLRNSNFDKHIINLLPNFDVYLLAHSDKNHFIDQKFYKRVFRNAGWISSVILMDGEIIGTWSLIKSKEENVVKIELFDRTTRLIKNNIENEVSNSGFWGNVPFKIRYEK